MNIFKILVIAIFSLIVLYFLSTILIVPKGNVIDSISTNVLRAIEDPGNIYKSKVNVESGFVLSTDILANNKILENYPNMYISFSSNYSQINASNQILFANDDYYSAEYSVSCNPKISYFDEGEYEIFESLDVYSKIYFCSIEFGENKKVYNKPSLKFLENIEIMQGTFSKKISFNDSNYALKMYLFKDLKINNVRGLYHLDFNQLYDVRLYDLEGLEFNINLDVLDVGEYGVIYIIIPKYLTFSKMYENFSNTPIYYYFGNLKVKQNYDRLKDSCEALNYEDYYFDFSNNKCVVKYNCSNCSLPSLCKSAWEEKGKSIFSSNSLYALGYSDSCGNDNDVLDAPKVSELKLFWPANSNYVTSCMGYRPNLVRENSESRNHDGIDIRGKIGDPVYSINEGVVLQTGGSYNTVVIDHGEYVSRYMHLDKIYVSVNENISLGQRIGNIGGYGPKGPNSYVPHLHFEILVKGIDEIGNIDEYLEEDVFLKTPFIGALAVNPLCFYDNFEYNNNSLVCNIQGGSSKWCSNYNFPFLKNV